MIKPTNSWSISEKEQTLHDFDILIYYETNKMYVMQ